MSVEAAVRTLLVNDSTLNSTIKSKVYPAIITQETLPPFLVYLFTEIKANESKTGASTLDKTYFSILSISATYSQARSIADRVRVVLDFYKGTVGGTVIQRINFDDERNSFDSKSKFYIIEQDYIVFVER